MTGRYHRNRDTLAPLYASARNLFMTAGPEKYSTHQAGSAHEKIATHSTTAREVTAVVASKKFQRGRKEGWTFIFDAVAINTALVESNYCAKGIHYCR